MLGQQWLNRYAQGEPRGSVVDRSCPRQHKMNGTVAWHFDFVAEHLPLMLQATLLLLSYVLSLGTRGHLPGRQMVGLC